MNKYRVYGSKPYNVIIVHGGPGAPGEVAPVCRKLSEFFGVIEPFQSKHTIDEQLGELYEILTNNVQIPAILVGYSWGAWLTYIFTSKYPELVKKLVLLSSGPFEHSYVEQMNNTRQKRLAPDDRLLLDNLINELNSGNCVEKKEIFGQFGKIMSKTDLFSPMQSSNEILEFQPEIFDSIMGEAIKLRINGTLLNCGKNITCPVISIHGDYDPHPYDGVYAPLKKILPDFKFILLEKCGHTPWIEKYAYEDFFKVLIKEIT